MAMSLEFTLTHQDVEEAFIVYHNSKPYLRTLRNFRYVIIILLGFFVALTIHDVINNGFESLETRDHSPLFIILLDPSCLYQVIGSFMWGVLPLPFSFLREMSVSVYIKESAFIYKIKEPAVISENAVMNREMEWSSIQKVTESKKIFLVFYDLKDSCIVPKRSFTEENINEFKEILVSNNIRIQKG